MHWALGFVQTQRRRHGEAIKSLQRAIELNRSYADAYALMGGIHTYVGEPAKTIPLLRTALRLNPDGGYLYFLLLGRAYLFENDVEQALINLREAQARNPDDLETRVFLAAALVARGDRAAAEWEADQIRVRDGGVLDARLARDLPDDQRAAAGAAERARGEGRALGVSEPSARQRLTIGLLVAAMGTGVMLLIYFQPQQLRAPSWVAYAAASTFVLAGMALVAGALGARKLVAWLGVLTVAALMTPAVWIAFGPGARGCSFSLGFLSGAASEWACRGAFGLGALLGAAILFLMLRQALRGR